MSKSNAPVAKFCFAQEDEDGEFVHMSVCPYVVPDRVGWDQSEGATIGACVDDGKSDSLPFAVPRLNDALDDIADRAWEKSERNE